MHCSVVYPVHMSKDFDGWNRKKKAIEKSPFVDGAREGDIWWCSVGVNIGSEQDGKNAYYERPVLILRKFSRTVVLTIPLTSKPKNDKHYFNFIKDNKPYSVVLSQLRLMSTKRLRQFILNIGEKDLNTLIITLVSNIFYKNNPRSF